MLTATGQGLGGRSLTAKTSAITGEVFGRPMKIQCISNSTSALPPVLAKVITSDTGRISAIELGKDYRVYAIATYMGHVWFYIADEVYLSHPNWQPAVFFNIVDSRPASCWRVGVHDGDLLVAFREWAEDKFYYDSLTEDDARALELWRKHKLMMDDEFNDEN